MVDNRLLSNYPPEVASSIPLTCGVLKSPIFDNTPKTDMA